MERQERERWNKLTDDAKATLRTMAKYSNIGRISLNDLRTQVDLANLDSRALLAIWAELAARDFGHIKDEDGPDPSFVLNVPIVQSLAQTGRLTHQSPHRPPQTGW